MYFFTRVLCLDRFVITSPWLTCFYNVIRFTSPYILGQSVLTMKLFRVRRDTQSDTDRGVSAGRVAAVT